MVSLANLSRRLQTLERRRRPAPTPAPVLARLRADPCLALRAAGMEPDPYQRRLLTTPWTRALCLCGRQVGKSTAGAAVAVWTALCVPGSLTLLVSASLRQSAEIFRKCNDLYRALGSPVPTVGRGNQLKVELATGSRIVSLPDSEDTIRCYSAVRLLVLDEAARISDGILAAVRPMLSVSRGRLLALTTPAGKRGWFYDQWVGAEPWERVKVTTPECGRVDADFLAEEERTLGPTWFAQEYNAEFMDLLGAAFRGEDIDAAFADPAVTPLWGG
jgi:hypothetical protein